MFLKLRKLAGTVVLGFWEREAKRFHARKHQVRDIQHRLLFEKLARNVESDFGRVHHFHEIRTIADFRARVPLADYSYYEPYIRRTCRGDLGAMFGPGARVLMFALTSGTTAAVKFIPITQHFFDEYRRGWKIWVAHLGRDHPSVRDGYILQLSSDWDQFRTEAGVPCGNISGLVARLQNPAVRAGYCVPNIVYRIPDATARYYTTARFAVACRKVVLAMTANPSTLVHVARLADQMKECLVRDVADGGLNTALEVPSDLRQQIRRYLRPNPRRARELERIIQETGTLYPKDYWPTQAALAVWTGGSVAPYLRSLPEYYGQVPIRDHGLSASEGRMTIPFDDSTSAGVLDFVSHYFEFVPEEESHGPHPTVLEAHELEEGKSYFIVLTTSSGLYRYDIQDLVRCVGFEGQAPVLEFLNKGAHFSSLTGEKLSEFQVVAAVRRGLEEFQLPVDTFTLAPAWDDPPYYQLLLEEGDVPPDYRRVPERFDQLLRQIDTHLQEVNVEYQSKRHTRRLGRLQLRLCPAGTWERLRQRALARGGSLEQYKHPCLVPDLHFVEKLAFQTPPTTPAR